LIAEHACRKYSAGGRSTAAKELVAYFENKKKLSKEIQ